MLSDAQKWLLDNGNLLSQKFAGDRVIIDGTNWQFILIHGYPLPVNWKQSRSRLLIRFLNISRIFSMPPNNFYLDAGLRTVRGTVPTHYFEVGDYNDLTGYGLARFSFHIEKGWKPAIPCTMGTNLLDVIEMLDKGMYEAAEEA
jgi:hypothetical protein